MKKVALKFIDMFEYNAEKPGLKDSLYYDFKFKYFNYQIRDVKTNKKTYYIQRWEDLPYIECKFIDGGILKLTLDIFTRKPIRGSRNEFRFVGAGNDNRTVKLFTGSHRFSDIFNPHYYDRWKLLVGDVYFKHTKEKPSNFYYEIKKWENDPDYYESIKNNKSGWAKCELTPKLINKGYKLVGNNVNIEEGDYKKIGGDIESYPHNKITMITKTSLKNAAVDVRLMNTLRPFYTKGLWYGTKDR
jgi:hypothetical protein